VRPLPWKLRYALVGLAGVASLGLISLTVRLRSAAIPEVDVVRASKTSKDLDTGTISVRGYIVPHHRIDVNSKVTGRVAWIGVEKGDNVNAGQVLVRLEDDEFRAQVQQAEGVVANAKAYLEELEKGPRPQEVAQAQYSLDQAEANMHEAAVTLDRTRELVSQGLFSRQALDDATTKYQTSEQQVRYLEQTVQLIKIGPRPEEIARAKGSLLQAEGQLAYAQSQLDVTVIRAPVAGTILERTVEKGELVTAQFATGADDGPQGSVVALADLNDVRVALDVPQSEFANIHLKLKGTVILDAFPDQKYQGVISEISPEASSDRGTVRINVRILGADSRLRPQMNATFQFSIKKNKGTNSEPSGALVPAGAVRDRQGKKVVFIPSMAKCSYVKYTSWHNAPTAYSSKDWMTVTASLHPI